MTRIRARSAIIAALVAAACPALAAGPPATRPAAPSDHDRLLGTWKIVSFQDDGGEKISRLGVAPVKPGQSERVAKLVVTRDEIFVLKADGTRDRLAGLTNCAWTTFTLDGQATPKAIDIAGVPGKDPAKPKPPYYGIYELHHKTLRICWNETPKGADAAKVRPRDFKSDGDMNMLACERLSDVPEAPKE